MVSCVVMRRCAHERFGVVFFYERARGGEHGRGEARDARGDALVQHGVHEPLAGALADSQRVGEEAGHVPVPGGERGVVRGGEVRGARERRGEPQRLVARIQVWIRVGNETR